MKRVLYQKLYDGFTVLTNRFDLQLLVRLKVTIGLTLIALVSSCSSDSDTDVPEVTCYLVADPDYVEVQAGPDTNLEKEAPVIIDND